MEFITEIIRKNIFKIITDNNMLILSSSKIFCKENKDINFEILLIDYYNTLMIKKSMGTLDHDDIKFLELINNNKVEDLKWLMTNFNFVRNAFIATVNFETLATLDKQNITQRAYEQKDNNDLTNRILYKVNLIANSPSHKVEDLLNYYKEYININGNELINHDTARDIIFGYLQDMKQTDFESYKANIFAAIPVFYRWGKYTISRYKKEVDIRSKIFMKRIEWLKLDDLLKLTKLDNDFLSDIITQYLYFETLSKEFICEIEEYSNKILSKKMKRKFENMEKNKTTRS